MVGYRNAQPDRIRPCQDFIRHSDGGVSEQQRNRIGGLVLTLSGIPMVGYRNNTPKLLRSYRDFIRHSDGGVSELAWSPRGRRLGLYQAFRWWGIGTVVASSKPKRKTLSGIPMVGYRNLLGDCNGISNDFIRHSDGGVSELGSHRGQGAQRLYQAFRWWGIGTSSSSARMVSGLYQAFRWWGIGTSDSRTVARSPTLSGIPMVGYRNRLVGRS